MERNVAIALYWYTGLPTKDYHIYILSIPRLYDVFCIR